MKVINSKNLKQSFLFPVEIVVTMICYGDVRSIEWKVDGKSGELPKISGAAIAPLAILH